MYREINGIVQKSCVARLASDSVKQVYFDKEYQKFCTEYEDIDIYVDSGGEEYYIFASGWKDCTQQELKEKERLVAAREEQKRTSDHNIFLLLAKRHPEWIKELEQVKQAQEQET